eukprot:CAMPEP_0194028908 /NCGR_PEP_ID=MMETSP0009_2-20130614/2782_1 /TAXON_ID=210454 /ORGANISM="Grammatophora oceanica, Strain CCMP 410" /LENGTH=435 /DNA_ID=CAMNT_0038668441 /DNA_START=274 /DNA_END=1581 /DNA_ORIENTATION=-
MKKSNARVKYKKAPSAPRRFKSAYMFFSTEKHRAIRQELSKKGISEKTTVIAKMVSTAWKALPTEERDKFEEMARKDKARFEVEKTMYTGPWKVPAKKRSQKDPSAPKRPMSAFLSFSHAKRAEVKAKNQNMNNAEISRVLASLWKDAPQDEKKEHIDREFELRQQYKTAIAEWRETHQREQAEARRQREELALQRVDARTLAGLPMDPADDINSSTAAEMERAAAGGGAAVASAVAGGGAVPSHSSAAAAAASAYGYPPPGAQSSYYGGYNQDYAGYGYYGGAGPQGGAGYPGAADRAGADERALYERSVAAAAAGYASSHQYGAYGGAPYPGSYATGGGDAYAAAAAAGAYGGYPSSSGAYDGAYGSQAAQRDAYGSQMSAVASAGGYYGETGGGALTGAATSPGGQQPPTAGARGGEGRPAPADGLSQAANK